MTDDANLEAHAKTDYPKPPKGSYDGLWMARRSLDEEFSLGEVYASRQEAIDSYADEYGEPDGSHFQTGRLSFRREIPNLPISADDLFDRASDQDDWHESALENFRDACCADGLEDELDEKLERLWEQFCEKHNLFLEGYTVEDVESHIVGQDESPEELARRKFQELDAKLVAAFEAEDDACNPGAAVQQLRSEIAALKAQHPEQYKEVFAGKFPLGADQ